MANTNPVPVPNPTNWAEALADLKHEGLTLLQPIVAFEAALTSKDAGQIIEAAAAVPQQVVGLLPGVGATVLGQLLSVVVSKATTALKPTAPAS